MLPSCIHRELIGNLFGAVTTSQPAIAATRAADLPGALLMLKPPRLMVITWPARMLASEENSIALVGKSFKSVAVATYDLARGF